MRHYVSLVNQGSAKSYLIYSRDFPDVTLACRDGILLVDLPTLGLLFTSLAALLPPGLQAPLAMSLPDNKLAELVDKIQEVTGGTEVMDNSSSYEDLQMEETSEAQNYVKDIEDDFVQEYQIKKEDIDLYKKIPLV